MPDYSKTCLNCACDSICDHNVNGWEHCGNWISVDAVEVVQCDQCRHMKLLDGVFRFCRIWNAPNGMGADGFCSYGERKDDAL